MVSTPLELGVRSDLVMLTTTRARVSA